MGSGGHIGVLNRPGEDLTDSQMVGGVSNLTFLRARMGVDGPGGPPRSRDHEFSPYNPNEYPTAEVQMHSKVQSESSSRPRTCGGYPVDRPDPA